MIKGELVLKEKVKSEQMSLDGLKIELIPIIGLFKYITACKIVIQYAKILKDKSIVMTEAQNSGDYRDV